MADGPACFHIQTSPSGTDVVIAITGEIDAATASALSAELEDAIASTAPRVVVDFSRLSFIDSSGLSMLIAAHRRLVEDGRGLVVRSAPPSARRLLEISGLDRVLSIE